MLSFYLEVFDCASKESRKCVQCRVRKFSRLWKYLKKEIFHSDVLFLAAFKRKKKLKCDRNFEEEKNRKEREREKEHSLYLFESIKGDSKGLGLGCIGVELQRMPRAVVGNLKLLNR